MYGINKNFVLVAYKQVIDLQTDQELQVENVIDEQTTREMITIRTVFSLRVNNPYRVSMKFISILNPQSSRGFYYAPYTEDGIKK